MVDDKQKSFSVFQVNIQDKVSSFIVAQLKGAYNAIYMGQTVESDQTFA
jgi:hypothetical protein